MGKPQDYYVNEAQSALLSIAQECCREGDDKPETIFSLAEYLMRFAIATLYSHVDPHFLEGNMTKIFEDLLKGELHRLDRRYQPRARYPQENAPAFLSSAADILPSRFPR